ncbi:ATP-grasp domain-containing protein [candidate division KSB1 bacterium]|nr:ATP-grasp domain-containing protein [candidate division KSB1 bacterium]
MLIGLTYDLRQDYLNLGYSKEETAEFDKEETIAGVETTLRELGYDTDRIGNIWQLTKRLNNGERWDLVFNIAEGMFGIGREAQVPAILDAYNIPYTFSDPLVLSLTLHKGMTKRVIRDIGVPTADFAEIRSEADILKVTLPFPLFVKPIAEGTGKGINSASLVHSQDQLYSMALYLLQTFKQPVLVETYLPGREYTVGIVGTGDTAKAIGTIEIILKSSAEDNAYSYENKEHYEGNVIYRPVSDKAKDKAETIALAAWRGLGCMDAGRIDLREDANGVPNFIEVNPLAGINPIHSDLPILSRLHGIDYKQLISMIMDNAIERLGDRINTRELSQPVANVL